MNFKHIFAILIVVAMLVSIVVITAVSASAADATLPEASDSKEIDVWLIAGQSNAIGSAYVSNYPTDEAYAEYKDMLTAGSSNVWYIGNSKAAFAPSGFGFGSNSNYSGPEIGFTTALDGNGRMNAIIKQAYGNTSLYNNTTSDESINYGTWTPPSYIEKHNVNTLGNRTGDLYLTFMQKVEDSLAILEDAGYTPVIRGVYYMQGEADTFGAASSAAYRELLETLIYDMRSDLTEIAGYDCAELPFVYGRIHRNPGINPDTGAPYADTTPYLTTVQAAQDAVDALGIKNVYMINFTTDLRDPVSGEQRGPVQQDGWHYDSLTQQMIGEKTIELIQNTDGEQTDYGFIPSAYTNAASNPFAIFKKVNGSYTFDSTKAALNLAFARARELTLAGVRDVVVLLRTDYTGRDYPEKVSEIGGNLTIDLNGKTLSAGMSLGNIGVTDSLDANGNQKKTVINIKNGKLLMSDFGIIFNAKGSSYADHTGEKIFDYNFDNVYLGFSSGAASVENGKGIDLLVSDRATWTNKNVRFNMNLRECTLDFITNAKAGATIGRLSTTNMTDVSMADYDIKFYGCTFMVNSLSNLGATVSKSGDSVKFMKGADGSFGKIISPASLGTTSTLIGSDDGADTALALKSAGQTDGKNAYSMISTGSIATTDYGTITDTYSDSTAYPLAVFHKAKGADDYTFVGGYSDWVKAITAAANTIKGVNGATKEDSAVILLRRDFTFSNLYSSTSVMGGTLTIDLGGYTMTCQMSLMNTTSADFSTGVGGSTYVNVKNGSLISATKYGFIYNRTGAASSYTVRKTYYFSFDNVYFGYSATSTSTKLLFQAEGTNITEAASIATDHVYNYNNCTIDMRGAPKDAVVAKLDAHATIEKLNYDVYFKNSRFITDTTGKIPFSTNANGDNIIFLKGDNGKYPEILLEKKYVEPDATYKFQGEGNDVLSYSESGRVEGRYKVYDLLAGIDTKYGYIDLADANRGYAVFSKKSDGGYAFIGSYTTWQSAFAQVASRMNAAAPTVGECVIYVTRDIRDSSYPENVSDLAGTVTIDLGGNTFTQITTLFRTDVDDCMAEGESEQKKLTVNISNGELVLYNFGILFATAGSGTYTTEKTIEFNIENVKFGYDVGTSALTEVNKGVDLLVSDRSAPSSVNVNYNFNIKNCTFDLMTNARSDARLGNINTANPSKDSTKSRYSVSFTDCTFITDNVNKITFTMSTTGDSVVMNADSEGRYSSVLVPGATPEFYTVIFDAQGGKSLSLVHSGTKDGYCQYVMTELVGELTEPTSYGTIPGDFVDTVSYPFALFYKDANGVYQFSSGYSTYTNAMNAAISLTKSSNASRVSEAVVLLRCDWSGKSFPTGTSDVYTKITVDLNGHTLCALESLTNTGTQDSLDPSGNKVATNGVIEYKNGSILMAAHGLIYAASKGSYTAGYEKTITFNFNNVYIGFYPGATGISLIGRVASNHTSATHTININFNGCTLDMVTNRSTHASLVFGNWAPSSDYTKVNTVYKDCAFIGKLESDMIAKTSSNDTVKIAKSEGGNYASLTLPSSAAAPTAKYVTDTGITLAFVKVSEGDGTVTYRLRPEAVANIDFVPKMSLTLDRNLVLNVYVPAKDFLKGFTLDGVEYTSFEKLGKATLGSELYYVLSISLDAKSAARDVVLKANVTVGGKNATGTFTFSVVKYAEKILADGSTVEQTLVRDVLSYVRAAYTYFKINDAASVSRINAILGENYDANNAPAIEGSTVANAPDFKSVTFVLDGTPAMRFYLLDGADAAKYAFYIGGTRVKTDASEDGKYIDIDVYAYALCETVTYKVDGADGGSFHINAYYEWSKTQNNENLTNLVARFWKYLQSARAYRDSVVEN